MRKHLLAAVAVSLAGAAVSLAGDLPYQSRSYKPLVEVIPNPKLAPVPDKLGGTTLKAARIAWPGDAITVTGEHAGIYNEAFKDDGITVEFYTENDLPTQVKALLEGRLHFLRGTMGQMVQAALVAEKAGTDLVINVQLTWSTAGDTIGGVAEVRVVKDLEGKTIVMMIYGPHPEYVAKILTDAGVNLSKVKVIWVDNIMKSDLLDGKANDPYRVLEVANKLPEGQGRVHAGSLLAIELGEITDAERGVPGMHELSSTANSPFIIADVYATTGAFYDKHPKICEKFFRATLLSQERLKDLTAGDPIHGKIWGEQAAEVLNLPTASEAEGAMADCTLALHGGNVQFFTGKNPKGEVEYRNGKTLLREIVTSFSEWGIIPRRSPDGFPIRFASHDFANTAGLKYANVVTSVKFDAEATRKFVESTVKRGAEAGSLDDLISLTADHITFGVNESDFDAFSPEYLELYDEQIALSQTHQRVPIGILGFADPSGAQFKQKYGGKTKAWLDGQLAELRQQGLGRATKVKEALVKYAEGKGIRINPDQFVPTGVGGDAPPVEMAPVLDLYQQAVNAKKAGDNAKAQELFKKAQELSQPCRIVEFRLLTPQGAEVSSLEDLMNTGGK